MPTIKIFKATICEVNIAGAKLSPLNNRITLGLVNINPTVKGVAKAILTSQIVALNILMVGISGVMGLQVLYPMGRINIVILCTFIGAVVNVVLNVLLIPVYGHNGTAVAYMLAEVAVTVSMFTTAPMNVQRITIFILPIG